MRARTLSAASLAMSLVVAGIARATPPLPAEHLDVARLPAQTPHWAFVYDAATNYETDARIYVYDGDKGRLLGQIDAGYYPGFALSADGKTTAVATTYWSRGWHGTRTDVVEFTDNLTLDFKREVVLPAKRLQGPPNAFNVTYSADQRFLYVANATPATSFTVVDVAKGSVAGEIETDGCILAIAAGARRVSSLCESGRLLTVVLNDDGHEASRSLSAQFFNADTDPIFVQGAPNGAQLTFLSFLGDVHGVDLSGTEPTFAATWSLVDTAERGKWRPGGTQVVAYHARSARLFVPMHRGGEGSHKLGGSEIWVFDTDSHKRLARWPVDTRRFGSVISVHVSTDKDPLLFALTENSGLIVMDPRTGKIRHVAEKVGQSVWYVVTP